MLVVTEILIRAAEILTVVSGLAGVCLSLGLIFSPGLIRKANRALNRQFMTESQLEILNPSLDSEIFARRYHLVCGGLLVVGSSFILLFLFVRTHVPESFGLFTDMAIECSILLGRTAGFVGLFAGFLLFFYPDAFKALGQKMNIIVDTRPVFNKLDTVSVDMDTIIIKYSRICGLVGLVVSAALIVISVVNFLGTSASLGARLWQ
ncbi:MAG: hypothetical protein GY697_12775 [Desulfobacterales bacterium]|nr:hypothetical protein [Desulfobacterales bacterium]